MLKVLLIDDEEIVLKGLEHVLKKTKLCHIVGKLHSAKNVLQVIDETRPQVIITDIRMPEIDGLELLQLVKEKHPHVEVIMLTGHAEFEYARKALRYGARDYLLKPCRYKQIESLLLQISKDVKQKNKHILSGDYGIHKENNQLMQLKESVLYGKAEEEPILSECKHYLMVLYYKQRHMQVRDVADYLHKFLQQFGDEIKVFEHLEQTILIVPEHLPYTEMEKKVYYLKNELLKKGIFLYGAYSNVYTQQEELTKGYKLCVKTIDFLRFNEQSQTIHSEEMKEMKRSKQYFDQELYDDEELIKSIFRGEHDRLDRYLKSRNQMVLNKYTIFPPCSIRNQIKHYMILVEKRLKEKNTSLRDIFGRDIESIVEIEKVAQFNGLLNWFRNMVVVISEYMGELNKELPKSIQDALHYITQHFAEELSMNQVADYVHLNPWYFSELFKLKVGVTFSDYITKVRMDEAKNLLRNTDLKNYEIAGRVGFKNATYFSVVFKKSEGVTPKVYRKTV